MTSGDWVEGTQNAGMVLPVGGVCWARAPLPDNHGWLNHPMLVNHRVPRSKRRRVRKKWERRASNWKRIFTKQQLGRFQQMGRRTCSATGVPVYLDPTITISLFDETIP